MQDKSQKYEHQYWIDFLRFLSVLLVIVIHVSTPLVNNWRKAPFQDFMVGNIYDSLARVSVPVFFMVSGYLLLNKQESVVSFYRKRMKKIFVPFIAWSVLYLLWKGYYLSGGYSFLELVKSIAYEILTGPTFVHLWFFYALLGVYILIPILRLFVSAAENTELWYFIVFWVFSGPIISTLEKFSGINIADQFGFITGYFGYFVLGYLLSKYDYTRGQVISFFLLYLTLGVGTAIGTWHFSIEKC